MEFTAEIIAGFLKGEILGDPGAKVTSVSKIEEGKEGTLAFLSNPKYEKYLYATDASIVLINKDIELKGAVKPTLIRVDNAYQAFASLLDLYVQNKPKPAGIDPNVHISGSAQIGTGPYIGAFSYIGENARIGNNVMLYPQVYIGNDVTIGDNTILFPGVKIYEGCIIGAHCIIHSGTVIGSDGFGFAPQDSKDYKKIPQIGNVVLEDHVELGSNVTVDRATMGSTIIRKGVKIDNLIQIAHNVEIGEHTVIAAQSGIAGSTKVGSNCMIGAQVGIVGHIKIADNVKIGAQSGVGSNVRKEGITILGSPAHDIEDAKRSMIALRYLPHIKNKVIEMEDKLKALEQKLSETC
jgi:UDP-3-O-[3-hydroxymyristoyl] glucosamine N-acyltransferase